MPIPVSETANSTNLLPLLTLRAASLTSPAFVNLHALLRRLSRICRSPHGVHGQCAEVLLGVNDEAVLVLLGKLSGGADDLVDQRGELHSLWVELELSGLDLRQVGYLVDEPKKVSTGAVHALQRLLRLFCSKARRIFDHHLGQSDDGIERPAQLMAHAGDELHHRRLGSRDCIAGDERGSRAACPEPATVPRHTERHALAASQRSVAMCH
jgi:hypothetical protein